VPRDSLDREPIEWAEPWRVKASLSCVVNADTVFHGAPRAFGTLKTLPVLPADIFPASSEFLSGRREKTATTTRRVWRGSSPEFLSSPSPSLGLCGAEAARDISSETDPDFPASNAHARRAGDRTKQKQFKNYGQNYTQANQTIGRKLGEAKGLFQQRN
jgi:hypothetical protein